MKPYTIYYTDNKQVFNNVWEGENVNDAIENAIDDLQDNNFTVLVDKITELKENNY